MYTRIFLIGCCYVNAWNLLLIWSIIGLLLYIFSVLQEWSHCGIKLLATFLRWSELKILYNALFLPYSRPPWQHLYVLQLADNSNQHLRNMALDALDESICAVLGSDQFPDNTTSRSNGLSQSVRTFTSLWLEALSILVKVVTDRLSLSYLYRWKLGLQIWDHLNVLSYLH